MDNTLDGIPYIFLSNDEGAAGEAEGGRPSVVEAEDVAVDWRVRIPDLGYAGQGTQNSEHHSVDSSVPFPVMLTDNR